MPMQRGGIKLGQDVNPLQSGIDAVGNRDVHQPIFSAERDGGFAAVAGQGEQPGALSSAHDDGKNLAGIERHACFLWHGLTIYKNRPVANFSQFLVGGHRFVVFCNERHLREARDFGIEVLKPAALLN